MPQKPSKRPKRYCHIRQNPIKQQTRRKINLAHNTYGQNDDAKSGKRSFCAKQTEVKLLTKMTLPNQAKQNEARLKDQQ